MFTFQPRGPVYLRKIAADGSLGLAFSICPDLVTMDMQADRWSVPNKCGPNDVEGASGVNTLSAAISMSFYDVSDKNFALAALGVVTPQSDPGTVSGEELPAEIAIGDVYFLGGKTRHRNITGLTIGSLVANTDYTLDATTGKVTFLTQQSLSPAPTAAYGYTDPPSVSLLSAAQEEYAFDMEYLDRQHSNRKGSLELYRVRFDPASGIDMMPDKAQLLPLKGSVIADLTRDVEDTEFGQFGRRVLGITA